MYRRTCQQLFLSLDVFLTRSSQWAVSAGLESSVSVFHPNCFARWVLTLPEIEASGFMLRSRTMLRVARTTLRRHMAHLILLLQRAAERGGRHRPGTRLFAQHCVV
ncbi:hypothetical protein L209DRAFT_521977 [Thermothelomyces heterothallicus CBS 203.75]